MKNACLFVPRISFRNRVSCVSVSGEEPSPKSTAGQTSMLRTGPDYEASGSTRDIHELQAALQAAQFTGTGTGTKYSGTQRDSFF